MKGQLDWIKVNINSFDDNKIKLISSMPNGDSIICIWFRLLFEAGKSNDEGYVYVNESIPYTLEMLSKVFNKPKKRIEQALKVLKDFMMIEIDDDNYIKIRNWDLYQSVDRLKEIKRQKNNERIKRYRENKKAKEKEVIELEAAMDLEGSNSLNKNCNVTCNTNSNVTCNTENVTVTDKIKKKIDIEKESKKEKDRKEVDIKEENENSNLQDHVTSHNEQNVTNNFDANDKVTSSDNIDKEIEDMISKNKSNTEIAHFLHSCYKERYYNEKLIGADDIVSLLNKYNWKSVRSAIEIGIVSMVFECEGIEKILKRWEKEKKSL